MRLKRKVKHTLIGFLIIICILSGVVLYRSLQDNTPAKDKEAPISTSEPITYESNGSIEERIVAYLNKKHIRMEDIGICFYDFEDGTQVSINEDTYFEAASTYKVPLAMLYEDMIARGELQRDTLIYFDASYVGEDEIEGEYKPGTEIALSQLLYDMIVYSNNTAGQILFEHLGGWGSFKEMASIYSDTTYDEVYYSYDNVATPAYMKDVLTYLYENTDRYQILLNNMVESGSKDYLDQKVTARIAQKYGELEEVENVIGIVYGTHTYSLAIYTSLGESGRKAIGDINYIVDQALQEQK